PVLQAPHHHPREGAQGERLPGEHGARGLRAGRLQALRRQRLPRPHRPVRGDDDLPGDPVARPRTAPRGGDPRRGDHPGDDAAARRRAAEGAHGAHLDGRDRARDRQQLIFSVDGAGTCACSGVGTCADPRGRTCAAPTEGRMRPSADRRMRRSEGGEAASASRRDLNFSSRGELPLLETRFRADRPSMDIDFADLLMEVVNRRASDLHLSSGAHPTVRVRGRLAPLEEYPKLSSSDTREIVYSILTGDQRQRLETNWQLDFAYSIPGHARFRVNAYYQRG